MASIPIISWEIDGEEVKTVTFHFLGLQNHTDSDCNHEIKRCLLLGRKAMINLDSILKSRDITLLTKVHLVKAMVFPIVMYGCESWTIEKLSTAEMMLSNCGVGEALRVPWRARRSNHSILKEINPEYSLERLMLKHQYFDHPPDVKRQLTGKDPDTGKD